MKALICYIAMGSNPINLGVCSYVHVADCACSFFHFNLLERCSTADETVKMVQH